MDDCVGAGGVADTLARGKDSRCQHQQGCGGGKGCVDHFMFGLSISGGILYL